MLFALWDYGGLDLPMARWFGTAHGFALRDHWLWATVLHEAARRVAWALQLALLLAVWWPFGVLRGLDRRERVHMCVATLLCLASIHLLKQMNTTSCPWDLREFGGTALYVPHWHWGASDGGPGRCFPAGHVSAALCFLPGYFWLRERWPRTAARWLGATLVAGLTIGLAQQVRGAHYLSHTLWAGWICWTIAAAYHGALRGRQR